MVELLKNHLYCIQKKKLYSLCPFHSSTLSVTTIIMIVKNNQVQVCDDAKSNFLDQNYFDRVSPQSFSQKQVHQSSNMILYLPLPPKHVQVQVHVLVRVIGCGMIRPGNVPSVLLIH